MTKINFLLSLNDKLSGLPQNEVEERLHFYSEMIEDRMEDGLTEEEAIREIGTVDEIADQIKVDICSTSKATNKRKKLKAWEIFLLILGSPLWISLLIAALAIFISLYVSLWSVIISLWSVFASLVATTLAGLISGIILCFTERIPSGIALISAGFICAGIGIFLFFGCKALTKATIMLTKKSVQKLKSLLLSKEAS